MRRYFMSAVVLVPLGASAAWADFVVAATASRSQAAAPASTAVPAPEPGNASQPAGAAAPRHAPSRETRYGVAEGFGERIPLRFAVRQIVPRGVTVTYGPGADPDALVDWNGGQGWNRVLFRAVHPLGLRLVMSRVAVQIRK